jgi:hypothetical protein
MSSERPYMEQSARHLAYRTQHVIATCSLCYRLRWYSYRRLEGECLPEIKWKPRYNGIVEYPQNILTFRYIPVYTSTVLLEKVTDLVALRAKHAFLENVLTVIPLQKFLHITVHVSTDIVIIRLLKLFSVETAVLSFL